MIGIIILIFFNDGYWYKFLEFFQRYNIVFDLLVWYEGVVLGVFIQFYYNDFYFVGLRVNVGDIFSF